MKHINCSTIGSVDFEGSRDRCRSTLLQGYESAAAPKMLDYADKHQATFLAAGSGGDRFFLALLLWIVLRGQFLGCTSAIG